MQVTQTIYGTVKSVWFRQVFCYTGFGLDRFHRIMWLSCNVKMSKTNVKLSKNSSKSVFQFVFNGVLFSVCSYTVTISNALQESGTRTAICWSVTVYNKYLFRI